MLLAWSIKRYLELTCVGCARSGAAESAPANHAPEGARQQGARSEPNAALGAVAVLAMCTALAWPSSGHAYTLRWTEGGATVRWNAAPVTLRVDPALSARMPQTHMAALVSESAAAWGGLENVPEVLVGDGAPGSPGYHKGRSNNGVYWIDDWSLAANALAVTVVTYQTGNGKIIDADVLINAGFAFAQLPHDTTLPEVYDLPAVLTHEVGHVLGLGESCEPGATMWPSVSPGDTSQRDLDADDRAGAERLYVDGLWSEAARGCEGASILGQRPHGGAGHGYVWAALAALLAARLRRPVRSDARTVRGVLAASALLWLGAPVGAEDPPSTPPSDPVPCLQLPAGDAAAAPRLAKLLDGATRTVTGRAVRVDAYERDGLIWTRFRVEGQDFAGVELEVPGGTLGGVTQLVSHHSMPRDGETLVIGLREHGDHACAHRRDGAVYGGSLGAGPAVQWEP